MGKLSPPHWTLANIKRVAADIMHGVIDILRRVANILSFFQSVSDFIKGKNTIFSKNSQILV